MRDVYEVFNEKMKELLKLRKEIAALRLVAPLLESEEADQSALPELPPKIPVQRASPGKTKKDAASDRVARWP
jgi:hypothetical protein